MTSHGKNKPRTLFSFVLSFQFRVQFRSESFYYIKAAACPLCTSVCRITSSLFKSPKIASEYSTYFQVHCCKSIIITNARCHYTLALCVSIYKLHQICLYASFDTQNQPDIVLEVG